MQTFNSNGSPRIGVLSSSSASVNAETVLASGTLASPAATIDLTSISGSYDDLVLRVWARSARAAGAVSDNMGIRFNNDSTLANYRLLTRANDDSTLTNASTDDNDIGSIMPAASSTAGLFGFVEIVIPRYAGAERKLAYTRGMRRQSDAGQMSLYTTHLAWENTGAITRVTLYSTTSNNFDTGTYYQLVGRKATTVITAVS